MAAIAAAFALVSCRGPEVDKPAVARDENTSSPPAIPATVPAASPTAPPKIVITGVAADAIYICVKELQGRMQQTAIELAPQVATLCRKAPEMGPCQYERETCRRNGGRVFTVDGTEITLQTEAEYDRRVMRVRMKSN